MTARPDRNLVREQAEQILASGVLGRSRFYSALLSYLVDCSERDHAPKEIEIAADVFNRGEGFDPSQDSMVRVYAHNLRQKLQQYYAERSEQDQITIPKGEYRIALVRPADSEPVPAADGPSDADTAQGDAAAAGTRDTAAPDADTSGAGLLRQGRPAAESRRSPAGFAVALVIAASLIAGVLVGRLSAPDGNAAVEAYAAVAGSPLWSAVTDDDLPITLVVGDYFIFGELDRYGNVGRMVREFDINSSRDLDEIFMLDPERAEQYVDLDLTYLPSSTAYAMRDLMAVLMAGGKDVRVVASSNLDTAAIRQSHIVFLGYLSGLGILSDFVFAGSELELGDTPDELVHVPSGQTFVSEAGVPSGRGSYRDYGLFSTMPGPAGNQFVFVAGMRDEGLMQTAEAVSSAPLAAVSIDAVRAADGSVPPAFELLFEVAGMDRTNLDSMVVHAATLAEGRVTIGQLVP